MIYVLQTEHGLYLLECLTTNHEIAGSIPGQTEHDLYLSACLTTNHEISGSIPGQTEHELYLSACLTNNFKCGFDFELDQPREDNYR